MRRRGCVVVDASSWMRRRGCVVVDASSWLRRRGCVKRRGRAALTKPKRAVALAAPLHGFNRGLDGRADSVAEFEVTSLRGKFGFNHELGDGQDALVNSVRDDARHLVGALGFEVEHVQDNFRTNDVFPNARVVGEGLGLYVNDGCVRLFANGLDRVAVSREPVLEHAVYVLVARRGREQHRNSILFASTIDVLLQVGSKRRGGVGVTRGVALVAIVDAPLREQVIALFDDRQNLVEPALIDERLRAAPTDRLVHECDFRREELTDALAPPLLPGSIRRIRLGGRVARDVDRRFPGSHGERGRRSSAARWPTTTLRTTRGRFRTGGGASSSLGPPCTLSAGARFRRNRAPSGLRTRRTRPTDCWSGLGALGRSGA